VPGECRAHFILRREGVKLSKAAFRSLSYALIATGFINLTYQNSHSGILVKSGISILIGAIYLLISFTQMFANIQKSKPLRFLFVLVALIALVLQFLK
jgi:hypothetical protein